MQANQANTFLHQLTDGLEVVVPEQRMAAAAVTINDQRRRAGKGRLRILRPAVAIDLRYNARHLVEARFEQQTTRAVLVLARAVARRAGQEDDLFILGGSGKCHCQDRKCEESSVHIVKLHLRLFSTMTDQR